MRLPDFILANTNSILDEWDAFARSVWPASAVEISPEQLRDHAEAILRAVAIDMKSPQSSAQQAEKSKGRRDPQTDCRGLDLASSQHAVGRAASGFDLRAVMAEYRALRASVVRLWFESVRKPDVNDLEDMTRFHEAMDESLAEAVYRYSAHVDKSREMFLSILGHDVRNPLNAIGMLALALEKSHQGNAEIQRSAAQILSSTEAAARMLSDFMDFAVSRLGRPMPVRPARMDLANLCREVVAEVRAAFPNCKWQVKSPKELWGEWDRPRIRQLFSNLTTNAVQHGDPTGDVFVGLTKTAGAAKIVVRNSGRPIASELMPRLFEPFVRGRKSGSRTGSVGL
jgi:signal transduction histidine kinase